MDAQERVNAIEANLSEIAAVSEGLYETIILLADTITESRTSAVVYLLSNTAKQLHLLSNEAWERCGGFSADCDIKEKAEYGMKPVVYIDLPEAPTVLFGECKDCFTVNLCCHDLPLNEITPDRLPQYAASAHCLHDELCRVTGEERKTK